VLDALIAIDLSGRLVVVTGASGEPSNETEA
jgi:hypothetical protein